jgi:hypothetical protein
MSPAPVAANDAPVAARRVVIAGGSGLIGRALAASLRRDGVAVDVLSRNPLARAERVGQGARVIRWAPADPSGVASLARALSGADAVVNTSGVPVGPWPWTPWRRRAIVASRVGTNERLVEAMALLDPPDRPRVFVAAAGTDAYAGLDAEPATEATDVSGTTGFLEQLSRDWEAAAMPATTLGVRVVLVRTAFVLARSGGLLPLLALPVRLGLGGRYGSGRQWFSWIHLDDLVAIYRRAIDDPVLVGPVNAASPGPRQQGEVATILGRVLRRPSWLPLPAWLLRLVLRGESTLLLGSRRVVPARLEALGFRFAYPDLEAALMATLRAGLPPGSGPETQSATRSAAG